MSTCVQLFVNSHDMAISEPAERAPDSPDTHRSYGRLRKSYGG